jgi:hypothetical protein
MEFGQNEEKHSEVLIGKDVKRVRRNRSERGRWWRAAPLLLLWGEGDAVERRWKEEGVSAVSFFEEEEEARAWDSYKF